MVLSCGVSAEIANASWNVGACKTISVDSGQRSTEMVTCACRSLGFIAVLSERLRPSTLFDSVGSDWPAELSAALARQPGWLLLPLLLYGLLALAAFAYDQRVVYSREVPAWAMAAVEKSRLAKAPLSPRL